MTVLSRPILTALVTAAGVAALAAPAVIALATGWIEIHFTAWNEQPGPDPTPIESWVALALLYVVWVPLVFVGLIAAYDRLGYKYEPVQHAPRPVHKDRRRRREAGMRYLRARAAPPAGAPRARPKRGASSLPDAPSPPDAPVSGGAPPRPPAGARDGD